MLSFTRWISFLIWSDSEFDASFVAYYLDWCITLSHADWMQQNIPSHISTWNLLPGFSMSNYNTLYFYCGTQMEEDIPVFEQNTPIHPTQHPQPPSLFTFAELIDLQTLSGYFLPASIHSFVDPLILMTLFFTLVYFLFCIPHEKISLEPQNQVTVNFSFCVVSQSLFSYCKPHEGHNCLFLRNYWIYNHLTKITRWHILPSMEVKCS